MKKETLKRKDQMRKNKSVQKLLFSFHTTIEQKGVTFNHDFGHSFPLFSSLLKKSWKKKRRMCSKNRNQKPCLSARSMLVIMISIL